MTLLPADRAGRQASAVAHELNNVLTVVRTYTHFARQPTTPEQQGRDLMVVAAAAERAAALVDWLACMNEETLRGTDELSGNEFISMLSARLQVLIPAGASVEIMRVRQDVCFCANALRLEHVVLSLVLAASQRSAETAFKFSLNRAVVDGQRVGLAAGEYAVLAIGCAELKLSSVWRPEPIPPPDQVAALLEPLTEVLRRMHGNLEVRISAGELRFEIYLPAVSSARRKRNNPRLALVPPSAQTVCIVENETAIRLAISRTLSSAGFLVLGANDGVVARKLLIEHGHAVTLLICDVGLIRDGEDFFAWLKATCPGAAVLLISGDIPHGEAKASSLRAGFLAKPFTPTALVSAARVAIAQGEADARGTVGRERLTVLIVDDEEVIRDSFLRLLGECDFETIVAKTGQQALQILAERRVDAIVADQFMPGLDGISLLESIKDQFPHCLRILCTGHPAADVVVNAVNLGRVQRVLPKAMHPVALRDEIERAVLDWQGQNAAQRG